MGKRTWKSRHNEYYKDGEVAPRSCVGKIVCRHLGRDQFRQVVKKAKKVGCYYNHYINNEGYRVLEIATESESHTSIIINSLKVQAIQQGVKLN